MAHQLRRVISELNNPTTRRMKFAHQPITRAAVNIVEKLQPTWVPSAKKWYQEDPTHAKTKLFRIGGISSMLAVSISMGPGTAFYYNEGDDGMFSRPSEQCVLT